MGLTQCEPGTGPKKSKETINDHNDKEGEDVERAFKQGRIHGPKSLLEGRNAKA